MTVITGIDVEKPGGFLLYSGERPPGVCRNINDTSYQRNIIRSAIQNNEPIEDKLNVIIVVSNPCLFTRRYTLTKEFIERVERDELEHVNLYVVELVYGEQEYAITNKDNKNHLQLRSTHPLWHKENMINLGIKKLLPENWKSVAWIDADIEFESNTWAIDTLKILNGCCDIVQLFSHCVDMDKNKLTMTCFTSFGYQYVKQNPYMSYGNDFWHPGFAWAITRKLYDKLGGLYQEGILGSSDHVMAQSIINNIHNIISVTCPDYAESLVLFQDKIKNARMGYVPGVIRHHFHGSKKNRKYTERWKILERYVYSPYKFIAYNEQGVMIPSADFPPKMLEEILYYFFERKEDE